MRVLSAFFLSIVSLGAQSASFNNVSTASGNAMIAPDSMVTAMGAGLATQEVKGGMPLQTTLGGVSVQVTDSAGSARLASLYYVSPRQIGYVLPAGTAPGMATVNILPSGPSAQAQVQPVAPALFSANGD